jgi:hypothetical protein
MQVSEPSGFFLSSLTQNLYLRIKEGSCIFFSCLGQVLAEQLPLPRCCCCRRVNLLCTCRCQKAH